MNKDKLEFVSAIITNDEGNVLLLKRRKDLKLDPGKYDLCSGHMKEGEVPTQTMYREIAEEIGVKQGEIKNIERVGDIITPHEKLNNTTTHMYLIQIDLSEEEINNRLKNVEEPEMENAQYVKNLNILRNVQKYSDFMRSIYTEELEEVFKTVQEKLNDREELKRKQWEEER